MQILTQSANEIKIGIIDADLISRKKHRFPNLACEKLSGYWKSRGAEVKLLLDFELPDEYDKIYISKVFTDTPVPKSVEDLKNNEDSRIHIGGTGFFYDQAPPLPYEIEHHMPDYHLYDEWIESEVDKARLKKGGKFNESNFRKQFREYTEYSIGFLTRGCFRKCPFCVNQKYNQSLPHSPLEEFHDKSRKKICLLDDNFFACKDWKRMFEGLQNTNKPFKFKQGLDERLLTDEKCKLLSSSKYDGDITFAFDNISDYDIVHSKLKMIKEHIETKSVKFYVLVGYEGIDEMDIENAFKRIELIFEYRCLPYIMRFKSKDDAPYENSKFRSLYVNMARWCNQPSIAKKMSYREFCIANQSYKKNKNHLCSAMKSLTEFESEYPNIAKRYFDIKFGDTSLSQTEWQLENISKDDNK